MKTTRRLLVPALACAALALAILSSCFDAPKPRCPFRCGAEAPTCPDAYGCGDDGLCHLLGEGGGLLACDDPYLIDAPGVDAVPGDAPPAHDAGPADAPLPPPDAPPVDAPLPPPDAPPVDAP